MQNVEKRVPGAKTCAVKLTVLKQQCTIFKGCGQTDPSSNGSVRSGLSTADITSLFLEHWQETAPKRHTSLY